MYIDLKTLFLLTVDIEAMLGLLLLFVWVQNTEIRAVAWWGCAHLLRALSIALYGMYGSVSDLVSIGLADAILFGSYAVTWSGMRAFNHREHRPGSLIAGATVWLLACQFPGFAHATDLHGVLSSAIIATFMWLSAYELWRGRAEWLISRWPAILIFFAQGVLFLLRTPLNPMSSLTTGGGAGSGAWMTVISTEALLVTISSAFILLAMAKERVELARQDNVTGLPNRYLFRKGLCEQFKRTSEGEFIAVHCINLDCFKDVNNALGHPIGDLLLCAVAKRLSGAVRKIDTVSRLGADEFAIVQPSIANKEQAVALARRLLEIIREPYRIEGHNLVLSGSVGMAVAPKGGEDADLLMKNADMALSCAKADGRGTYRVFEPEMDARLQARMSLELDLRSALSRREFEIVYQPIVDLSTNEISGFEALLRWHHPRRGLVMPDKFIGLAEDTEVILPLGEWLLRRACADAARWPGHWKLAVNLSPVQFRSGDLAQSVIAAVKSSRLSAQRLELEITESVMLQDSELNLNTLHQLRDAKIRIVMDDFGAGYSSLSYLRKFRFDGIKVDRSLIVELPHNLECIAIVRAVAGIAVSLGICTTAEGVETVEQLRHVRQEGYNDAQGFLFGPPRTASEIEAFIARCPVEKAVDTAVNDGKVSTLPVFASRPAAEMPTVKLRA
jgi:diguanylate cyclase (GGDEF)-like protein